MFDVGRSMFDVQSIHCSAKADQCSTPPLARKAVSLIGKETMPIWRSFTQDLAPSMPDTRHLKPSFSYRILSEKNKKGLT
jgi:hypothetical protein